ncbi:CagC family type IV secretion system protein [Staphylococcus aureus]|uniref:CagC family type IV secretion system protein n=1 Tax=Staphylococcus aureus TaxID=1280 RepID=UPI00136558DD|nr:CagC family type IV secretion system protein [Staphylococcus aureus]QHK46545.1 conjugal transfer protein [Staphylococcus aureus]
MLKSKKIAIVSTLLVFGLLLFTNVTFAADAGQVEQKVNNAGNIIKGILSGIIVLVGVCVATWISIKRMKDADNPREKSELYSGIGRVAGLIVLAGALPWLIPWLYGLLQ